MSDTEIISKCRELLEKISAEYADKKTKPSFYYDLVFLQGVMTGRKSNVEKQAASERS